MPTSKPIGRAARKLKKCATSAPIPPQTISPESKYEKIDQKAPSSFFATDKSLLLSPGGRKCSDFASKPYGGGEDSDYTKGFSIHINRIKKIESEY